MWGDHWYIHSEAGNINQRCEDPTEDGDAHLQPAITAQRFVTITCTLLYHKAYNFLMLSNRSMRAVTPFRSAPATKDFVWHSRKWNVSLLKDRVNSAFEKIAGELCHVSGCPPMSKRACTCLLCRRPPRTWTYRAKPIRVRPITGRQAYRYYLQWKCSESCALRCRK